MKSHRDFLDISTLEIWDRFAADLAKIEKKRRLALATILCVFFFMVGGSLIFMPAENPGHYIALSLIVALVPATWMYRSLRRRHWLLCKPLSHYIVRSLLGSAYRMWGIIEADELDKHGILPAHCRLYREEGYVVNLHGYSIRFQEIDAVRSFHPVSVREWRERSVGSGLYVDIRMRRTLPAHTILLSRNMHSFLKRFVKVRLGNYKPVGLVSPRFKDRFEVLSTDQVEARVAFHPAFMEKFMDIADCLQAKSVEASFKDNKLLIHARYKHDMFQLGHFLRAIRPDDIDALKDELKIYAGILEILKLNPYTAP